jgi:DNA-binding NarL/FixJ family response regulator
MSDVKDLRVLVVATDPLSRAGLATLLSQQPGCSVVGQVVGESDLSAALEVYRPDVLVWDLGWNPTSSLEHVASQPEGGPPIVALLPDEAHIAAAWAAGASGFLSRDADATRVLAALVAVSQGLAVLGPGLAAAVLPNGMSPPFAEGEGGFSLSREFTPRELEVLRFLAEGLTNKAIAPRLGISEHTVKFHVNSILGKLGAQSRTEAVVRATRLGLISL